MNKNYINGIKINWNNVSLDAYEKNISTINKVNELIFNKPITFFVGENGSGKSTILETIAECYGLNKEGGSINYNFSTFNEKSNLVDASTIYKGYRKPEYSYFFRAETFFNVASKELEYSNGPGGISEHYHEKSHGESFYHLFSKLANTNGLFLLDEPEAALSPRKQLSLFSLIYESSCKGSQFIIISHSPVLLAIPNSEIYLFSNDGINKCKYEDTDSFKITKSFIDHKDIMIEELTKTLD